MPEIDDVVLIEATFADAIRAIETGHELPLDKRRHWACSLRVVAQMFGRPVELVPARWTAVRIPLMGLHHAQRGVERKTLSNHHSNVRAALAWFGKAESVPRRGAPLASDWKSLLSDVKCFRTRSRLSSAMRYWSAQGISPSLVDEGTLDAYMRYRAETTGLSAGTAARRAIARAWNSCINVVEGWPMQKLEEPPSKALTKHAWEMFPVTLQRDVEAWLTRFLLVRKSASGRRYRPCKASTIKVRRARLIAFARKAVALGVPIESLVSLRALLSPDLVEKVLGSYSPDTIERPTVYTIDLAAMVASCARDICMEEAVIARLSDMRAELETYRAGGLTEKNLSLIRRVMTQGSWSRVVALPAQLMREAGACNGSSPVKAAVLAQMACAICILTMAPVRLGNLAVIRLDAHLIRPGGPDSPVWLNFPDHDVKNRVRLEFPFDQEATALIDEYLYNYLPILQRRSNEPFIFPGENGGHKGSATLSAQITQRIQRATGLRITVHQFRHAAAAIILQADPGNYEFVRRLLGHKNFQTTINFYVGLETSQAARKFGTIVRGQLDFGPEPS